ncbi:Peptidase M48, Ste24p precursor [hydrothermal vent metagenome]|uniref:Peptidase M48, Ste24p n=1 Tax=hydrothermal vent metagenome TaxID=652676 RepID=A0A3B0VG33_9ZZZZ
MSYIKTAVLLGGLAALLIFFGGVLGGRQGAIIGLVFAGVMNFGTYWFSDKIVLKMYGAKPVTAQEQPDLYATVRVLAENADLPMPKVYIMNKDAPNAFATGRNPSHAAVAVTSGLMKLLSREELGGVIGHELTHVKNRDILISTIAATVAGAISYMAQMAMWASLFSGGRNDREGGGNPAVLIVMMIVGPLAAMIIQMAISRSREYAADKGGADITGHPLYLAEALKKLEFYNKKIPMQKVNDATAHMFIVSPLSGGGTMRKLFSTHPPMAERIKRLEAMAKDGE